MPHKLREVHPVAEAAGRAESQGASRAGRDRGIHDGREEEADLEAKHGEEKKTLKKERET
jgi:hypothetical protein